MLRSQIMGKWIPEMWAAGTPRSLQQVEQQCQWSINIWRCHWKPYYWLVFYWRVSKWLKICCIFVKHPALIL
jgi:hypothetical protein